MGRRKKSDSEKDASRRSRGKATGKQAEDVLQHIDVEASPHLGQMSLEWQRLYAVISRTVRS